MNDLRCETAAADVTDIELEKKAYTNRRASEQATRAANARNTSGRRRFVDPTTNEKQYSDAQMEFMNAMQQYKQQSGRMFPTWSEVLEVLLGLGYQKVPADYLAGEANLSIPTA